jgi:hypothetical protein
LEGLLCGLGKERGGGVGRKGKEDLEESPALPLVAFGGVGALAFEVDVIDEGEAACGRGRQKAVVFLQSRAAFLGEGSEEGGKGAVEALGQELALLGEGGGEEGAQFLEARGVQFGEECGAGIPGTGGGGGEPRGEGDPAVFEELEEGGETFLEGAAFSGGVPDEVADTEGGEVFAGVPGGESLDFAIGLVLPDAATDLGEVLGGERGERGERGEGCEDAEQEGKAEGHGREGEVRQGSCLRGGELLKKP